MIEALRYERGALYAIDQTLLPAREHWLELRSPADVRQAITRLAIRGAPLIGVAAAYAMAMAIEAHPSIQTLTTDRDWLVAARPTAINLAWAADRVCAAVRQMTIEAEASNGSREAIGARAFAEARAIHTDEIAASEASAHYGADLLSAHGVRRVLTHCNTGSLAAPGRGCALSVASELFDRGLLDCVTACETRPLLQGARLTIWELGKLGIPHELIVDGAAAGLIARGHVDAVIVGCDRVAANGDVANKVGTYAHALAAREAGIPFVVIGPTSTIDPGCPSGDAIVIEERAAEEVAGFGATAVAPPGTVCRNPAFDVTPARFITALVTERGIARPVDRDSIAELLVAQ